MSIFRSERVGYYNIVFPTAYAWEVMNELGDLSALEFIDQNENESNFTRPYSNYIKRCEEMESKIKTITATMANFGVEIKPCEDFKYFLEKQRQKLSDYDRAGHTYFEDLETKLHESLTKINGQINAYDKLVQKLHTEHEKLEVIRLTKPHLGSKDFRAKNVSQQVDNENPELIDIPEHSPDVRFSYLAGVINKEDSLRFKRILFRVTRGMTYTVLIDMENQSIQNTSTDPNANSQKKPEKQHSEENFKQKTVFLIIYQGGSHDVLKEKLNKICDSFGASKYSLPKTDDEYLTITDEKEKSIDETKSHIEISKDRIYKLLEDFSAPDDNNPNYPSYIEEIRLHVLKEKSIYHNLNMFTARQQILIGYCWCPLDLEENVKKSISQLYSRHQNMYSIEFNLNPRPEDSKPPTYFKLNEFTWAFQEIVNTYGTPRYREVNPGLFTIATFPFLFGVMFGDIGHGGLLFAFGAYLTIKCEDIRNSKSALSLILPARYLLLLMGFFAFYCGLIYNDFMSIPFNLFGSCYDVDGAPAGDMVAKNNGCTYPFGVDPAWSGTQNELTFFNSLKMKLAVILGVIQMTFGIILKSINTVHFGEPLEFLFEFLPQLIFMMCTFIYMDTLIFIKWTIPWGTAQYPTADAPSIITTMINMPLKLGSTDGVGVLYGNQNEQSEVQLILLLVALGCVPVMLLVKPLILLCKHNSKKAAEQTEKENQEKDESSQQLLPKNQQRSETGQDSNAAKQGSSEANRNSSETLDRDHHENTQADQNSSIVANKDQKQGQAQQTPTTAFEIEQKPAKKSVHGSHHGEEFEFGEVFVHQVIETIEFVLGSISNTASYLRLWALSLAHGQLATVFFANTLGSAIINGSIAGGIIGFFIFANITFAVLMCMDVMECFLHALRLHWVEFQNKFYKADGQAFQAFSFESSLKASTK